MGLYKILFSPTGTSRKVADEVANALWMHAYSSDHRLDCCGMSQITDCDVTHESGCALSLKKDDLAIFAAPVYGGKMAPIAKERMRGIKGDGTPCVVISVYGNRAFENALNDMAEFVNGLGFTVIGAGAFIGEHSYSTSQYPIAPGRPDPDDLEEAKKFGTAVFEKMMSGKKDIIDSSKFHDLPSSEESLVKFRGFIMDYQKRQQESPVRLIPVVKKEMCNECGTCVDVCPTNAISDDCFSVDASLCIKCCACVKVCPSGARSLASPFAPVLSECFSERKKAIWSVD